MSNVYAEFYRRETRPDGSTHYVECVGDRSVIRLDGRMSQYNQEFTALLTCRERGYDGYRLFRGSLLRPFYLNTWVIPAEKTI